VKAQTTAVITNDNINDGPAPGRAASQAAAVPTVPTGYAELLFGVWKGFRELRQLGLADTAPAMVACEPAARAPLARAIATGRPALSVEPLPTAAYSAAVSVSGYRGVVALRESNFNITAKSATRGTIFSIPTRLTSTRGVVMLCR